MPVARRNDFDVVIVGGGMVGSCLAGLIARDERLQEWRVALVEPSAPRAPRDGEVDLRVSALSRASQRILQAVEAWSPIAASACPYSDMVVWDAAGRWDGRDALRFSAAEIGEPDLGHIAENLRVQWALQGALRRCDSVVPMQTSITAMETGEHGVRVEFADGSRVSCGLLVGADGGASRTRELAGIGRAGWAYGQTAVVAHLASERPHRSTAWQRFLPSGPLALLPLRDGRVSLVWTLPTAEAEQHLALEPAEFSQRVTEASDGPLGALRLDSAVAGFPLALWHAREYCRPRLALVGDAAHTTHPLAGQGVNMGFLDCATLVEVLSGAVADYEDVSSMRVLRRYERWRRAENALFLGLTDSLNRLFADRGVASAAARRLGLSVIGGQAVLRRRLAEHALGLRGDVPAIVSRPT